VTILKSDWLKDTVWVEWHLTAGGWTRGTMRTEKGAFENEVLPPPDCLMSIRTLEFMPTSASEKPADWSVIRWIARDAQRLEAAQEKWGVLPLQAPALSADSANEHPEVKRRAVMQMSENQRPVGTSVRRRRRY
jgi:hypothetical protein